MTVTSLRMILPTLPTVMINGVSFNIYRHIQLSCLDELEEKSDRLGNEMDNELSEISSSIGTMEGNEIVGPMGAIGQEKQVIQPYDFDNLPPHACASWSSLLLTCAVPIDMAHGQVW